MEKFKLNMNSVILYHNGTEYDYTFSKQQERGDIHSISKPITCLCMGLAIEQGYFPLGLNEPIIKYLNDYEIISDSNRAYLQESTIWHLLTLTLGHEKMLLSSKSIADLGDANLVDYVLNEPILHKPGSYFAYTSSAAYLVSFIIQKVTKLKLLDYAKKNLFNPLGILDVEWRESLQGYSLGCTGVTIANSDLNKIGQLFLNNGVHNGMRIVSSEWIKKMKSIQVKTPNMFNPASAIPKYGYGLNLWICDNGNYFCDGTDGQYIIVIPSKEIVISTIGNQSDMSMISECLREIIC